MLLISYDFTENKVRAKFAKFLKKYGRKLQYSVYEIKNSPRILNIILNEIELKYKKLFTTADSILIFPISEADETKTIRYGYAAQEEQKVVMFS